ncbi:hypothetical protein AMS68_001207 [Peltaster fructicola]|uniref:Pyridoxamine kinase/Phosphomethylpyrimidine kinase domain-containing protein n=1 Tax=Peltaster fructicola TaxID=286661 RepID=A0A6H0XMH0_9PEZI|nr:hypothetical protein AMS68_001207 [Peltaster fructicola]
MKRILVIAGSDSSGGAGLEADQKVIAAHGCYAMTTTTALTAQNTQGVYGIHMIPPEFVHKQIDACIEDIGVDVVKTEDAVQTLCKDLLPNTTILTPNISEALLLLKETGQASIEVSSLNDMKRLAQSLHTLGPKYILVKGGHLPLTADGRIATAADTEKIVANVLYDGSSAEVIELPYQTSPNTHGTGCSLGSAIACNLANGMSMLNAVRAGCKYVSAGIETSISLGRGAGPLNHFHSVQILPFTRGDFIEYLLRRDDVQEAWKEYTHHEFTRKLGDGSLDPERFKYYMIQDYLYLIQFARANALAGYKAKTLDDIAGAARIVTHIRHEINLHIGECKQFGLTQQDMEAYDESQACTAYTRYVLDIGQSEDWLALQIALLPCLLGYGMIAARLHHLQITDPPAQPNRYLTWINNYVAEDYVAAVRTGRDLIEKHAIHQSPKRIEELVKIFIHATKMETGFWQMASTG